MAQGRKRTRKSCKLINNAILRLFYKEGDFLSCSKCKNFHIVGPLEVAMGFGKHYRIECPDPDCGGVLALRKHPVIFDGKYEKLSLIHI